MVSTRTRALGAIGALATALAACSTAAPPPAAPRGGDLYQSQTAPGARLDKAAAVSMITELRRGRGLPPVALDAALDRLAEEQASAMARSGKLSHTASAGSLKQRVARSGYRNGGTWENIGGGHDTLADAFTGWRSSPPHLRNMLQPKATRMGIAAVKAPNSRYEVFWALVMADPNDPRPLPDAAQAAPLPEPAATQPGVTGSPLMAGSGEPR